ncbi:MAG: hypothetical protein DRP91_00705 [Candidatus Neomarinimicrobiota bacterium]|nr:PorV/PorQ family protein [Candidatus Neomarinimicrobiota bacterium]RKY50782.1 MAG: hypothetical protein DRP91_00705 [Candidatus Neomarinimicrobiota bacterium]
MKERSILVIAVFFTLLFPQQKPNRVGTTAANFLEIGMSSSAISMGDAYVSVGRGIEAVYWNPAGLAFMRGNEVTFSYQPWLVDINLIHAAGGISIPSIGNFALSLTQINYGDIPVTTVAYQDGTGEVYTANEYSLGMSYARKLTTWFSFGASVKLISSQIWHCTANAFAVDLGVVVNTGFFTVSGERGDGLTIGMSISNYGTKMKYDGIDLLNPIDISPDEAGNYGDTEGKFETESWELPLIFRIGVSYKPIVSSYQNLLLSVDAIHPNNNTEYLNLGVQYELKVFTLGSLFLRGGYKALFMPYSEYGPTFGFGLKIRMPRKSRLTIDYAYRRLGILGNYNVYTIGFGL